MVDCLKDCNGACCKCDVYWQLTPQEAKNLLTAGTKMHKTGFTSGVAEGKDEYYRLGECGLVDDNKCKVHDNAVEVGKGLLNLGVLKPKVTRPEVCEKVQSGQRGGCLNLRRLNPDLIKNMTTEDNRFKEWYESDDPTVKW